VEWSGDLAERADGRPGAVRCEGRQKSFSVIHSHSFLGEVIWGGGGGAAAEQPVVQKEGGEQAEGPGWKERSWTTMR